MLVKLGRYIDHLKIANITGASFLSLCQAIFWILFLGHLFACLWFGTVNLHDTVFYIYIYILNRKWIGLLIMVLNMSVQVNNILYLYIGQ